MKKKILPTIILLIVYGFIMTTAIYGMIHAITNITPSVNQFFSAILAWMFVLFSIGLSLWTIFIRKNEDDSS